MKRNLELPGESRDKEGYRNAFQEMYNVYIHCKFYIGKAMSAVKHSAVKKPNQQINEKDGEKKRRNDSGIVNRPIRRGEPSADIYTLTTKCVIYKSVCCTRIWKNTL